MRCTSHTAELTMPVRLPDEYTWESSHSENVPQARRRNPASIAGGAMAERIWFLKNCDLFARLEDDALRQLEMCSRYRKVPARTPIYLPADQADAVLLLVRGRVKLCTLTAEGKQGILAFIEPGELFGELSLIDQRPREEYAEAVEESQIVLLPHDVVLRLADQDPHLALGITKLIGLRRRRIERRLKYLLFHSNRLRLIHLLIELAQQYGQASRQGLELTIRLSHQDLANVIGTTRESVTVLLGKLQAEKRIRVRRKLIIITDLNSLLQEADGQVAGETPVRAS